MYAQKKPYVSCGIQGICLGGKALVSPSAFLAAAGAQVPPCAQQLASYNNKHPDKKQEENGGFSALKNFPKKFQIRG